MQKTTRCMPIIVLICLFSSCITRAQTTFKIKDIDVHTHSLPVGETDTVNFAFIPSTSGSTKTLLFVQGSGAVPLFYKKENDSAIYFSLPFEIDEVLKASTYNLLLVSPPGVDCIEERAMLDENFYKVDERNWPIMAYRVGNNLESHLRRYHAVIDFVGTRYDVNDYFVMAHSQGSRIATALANQQPKIVKLMISSVNPESRGHEKISSLRVQYLLGQIDFKTVQEEIESEYKRIRTIHAKQHKNTEDISELSFTDPSLLSQLLKIKQPILFAYGSADFGTVIEADKMMLAFIQRNKENLFLRVYEDMDHNLFENDVYSWKHLFRDALAWFGE